MPTLVIWARCNASISEISFWTGKSRSGRITIAISGLVRFIPVNRVTSSAAATVLSSILIVSRRSIEIVWTVRL